MSKGSTTSLLDQTTTQPTGAGIGRKRTLNPWINSPTDPTRQTVILVVVPVTPSGRMSETNQGTLAMFCLVIILIVVAGIVFCIHMRKKAKMPESRHNHQQNEYHLPVPVKKTYSRFSQVDEELTFCRQSSMAVDDDPVKCVELIRYSRGNEDLGSVNPTRTQNSEAKTKEPFHAPFSQRPSYLETPL